MKCYGALRNVMGMLQGLTEALCNVMKVLRIVTGPTQTQTDRQIDIQTDQPVDHVTMGCFAS